MLFPDDVSRHAKEQGFCTVLDFGAYVGDYAQRALTGGASRIYSFEPIPKFARQIRERFAAEPRVVVCEFAVGRAAEYVDFYEAQDATGQNAAGRAVSVRVEPIQALCDLDESSFEVAKINIEGGEYDLVPLLRESGLLARIKTIFIQFHIVDEASAKAVECCRQLLSESHRQTWNFPYVWERWDRNGWG